ncbi:hypothetical protein [Paraburkholderia sp. RL17-337-BIB-A]|uniref:hypothetical protein n=1 Tax=Paraburkholderia sp. RL17-337-BIB-A TaxID=3031636 RepID=UPI0038BC2E48
MLRVTVELFPGGSENGKRILAHADISNVKPGALASYRVQLFDDVLGDIGTSLLTEYPRMATTIWDLVGRGIAVALTGKEQLPERPLLPDVPVHKSDGDGSVPYVRFAEIPEPARTLFKRRIAFSTCPVIDHDPDPMDCAYLWDWEDFLAGRR